MKIGRKKDLWHLVQKGILVQLHADTESSGLDMPQIFDYGDAAGDIAGNLVDSVEIKIKRPEHVLSSIYALEVTRTVPQELDDPRRVPHPEGMGRIAERYERAATQVLEKMPLHEREIGFSVYRKKGNSYKVKPFVEKVKEYPLKDGDGNTVADVRYHPRRRMISYRVDENPASPHYENVTNNFYKDPDGSKWKLVEPRLLNSGWNVKRADFSWYRSNFVRAGFPSSDVFFPYSRATLSSKQRSKPLAVDALPAVSFASTFGPQGEDGVKLGLKKDPATGEMVISKKIGLVMAANTRYASPQRGIAEGVRMPDLSIHKEQKAHRNVTYDAKASFSIYNYARERAPEVMRTFEIQADEKELRRALTGGEQTETPPIFAMPRNTWPPRYPLADPVTFLGFDDDLGKMNNAIVVRLDEPLDTYRYKGKRLGEMSEKDFADMIETQRRDQSQAPLVRLEPIRRWPGAVRLEDALKAGGAGTQWDFEQVDASFRYLVENPDVCERMRGGVAISSQKRSHRPDPANPLMEEQGVRNGFGDLDYLQVMAEDEQRRRQRSPGGHGAVAGIFETLYNKAVDEYNFYRSMDAVLKKLAVTPHPVDWSNDEGALDDFHDLLKRRKNMMGKKKAPHLHVLKDDAWVQRFVKHYKPSDKRKEDDPPKDNSVFFVEARDFRWKLAKRILKDDMDERRSESSNYTRGYFDYDCMTRGRLLYADVSRDFRIVNRDGRELDLDYIREQHAKNPSIVLEKLDKGDWRIQFHRLSSKPSLTATLDRFGYYGKTAELPVRWQFEAEALNGHRLWGPPNTAPEDHRWQTIPRLENDIKKLELNVKLGKHEEIARVFSEHAKGEADVYMWNDESQRILEKTKQQVEAVKKKFPLSETFRRAANYEPETGMPYDWIQHELDSRKVVVVDVPDAHLRRPLEHIAVGSPYALVVHTLDEDKKKKIGEGFEVVLRGAQTGRHYYAGPVGIRRAPQERKGFHDFYRHARAAYEDSGARLPGEGRREVLLVEKLKPLAQTRRKIDPAMQAVKVPSLFFDALVSPRLAHFPEAAPLTTLVVPVDYMPQDPKANRNIRFREMDVPLGAKLDGESRKDTGHVYESMLRNVKRMKVGDIRKNVSDAAAQNAGFGSAFDMWEKIHTAFLNQESPDPAREEVYVLNFDRVKKSTWAYFDPTEAPKAALTYKGQPVPPSAYRAGVKGRKVA